jgi:hypothetical protein
MIPLHAKSAQGRERALLWGVIADPSIGLQVSLGTVDTWMSWR